MTWPTLQAASGSTGNAERLENAAGDARAIIAQRRTDRNDVEAVSARALDMGEFLKDGELSERRAFVTTFVREIAVKSGSALVRYTIPMPQDCAIAGRNAEEVALGRSLLSGRRWE